MLKERSESVPIIPEISPEEVKTDEFGNVIEETDSLGYPLPKVDTRPIINKRAIHESLLTTLDSDWVTSAFMVSSKELEPVDATNRYWSTANVKFTDTRPGGNIGINSKPQFTRYSDIRARGRLTGRVSVGIDSRGNHGMGRYYSESIDDHEQTIFMEFGVPKFNSLTRFFSLAIDPNAAFTANTGRASFFRGIGQIAGKVLMITTFPVLSISIWITQLASKVLPASSSKFYSLKPTMFMYWSMVNALTTATTVNLGMFPAALTSDGAGKLGLPMKPNEDKYSIIRNLMPELFGIKSNYVDVFAIANRAQILAQEQSNLESNLQTAVPSTSSEEAYEEYIKTADKPTIAFVDKGSHSFANYMNELENVSGDIKSEYLVNNTLHKSSTEVITGKDTDNKDIKTKVDIVATTESDRTKLNKPEGDRSWWEVSGDWMGDVGKYFKTTVNDGSAHAIFHVEYTGTVNESFSTSVKDPAVKSILNTTSGAARDIKFNLAGGDVGFGPVGKLVKYGAEAITSFISGGLSEVTFGLSNVLSALLGGGYIDVPKQWEDSTVNLPKISYKMSLVTPYGNDFSLLQNIYIPLNMLLAGALPLATGKASYTSPFLCSIYDRGKQYIKLGIIDSLSITRGTTNLGFTTDGKPLGVEITFTVLDLSSIMAVPISDGGLFGLDMTLDEDHLLSTYLSVITGRSLLSQRYFAPRVKYNLATRIFNIQSAMSPSRMGMLVGDSLIGDAFGVFARRSQIIPK